VLPTLGTCHLFLSAEAGAGITIADLTDPNA